MSNQGRYRERLNKVAENWRALALRGLVAVLFGVVVLLRPSLILTALTLFFGVYALIDGAFALVPALRSSNRGAQRWLPLTEGAVGVVAGVVALFWQGLSVNGLLYVIAVWAVVTGILKIISVIVRRREIEGRRPLIIGGALTVLFGVVLAAALSGFSDANLPSLARLIGVLAVLVGLAMIAFAFRIRRA